MNTMLGRSVAGFGAAALLLLGAGCRAEWSTEHPANPVLRPILTPGAASVADVDRAALARFVGTWEFAGWASEPGGTRREVSGRGAATIETGHFVLLCVQATSGTGQGGRTAGSMLMASEPGIGLTMTTWGDASPSVSRLTGRVEGNASAFVFKEVATAGGRHRLALNAVFETDDRWVAEVRNDSASGDPMVARYVFTRTAQ